MGDPSLFDYFYVLFPNCERELICLPRRFQDSETSLANNPFVQSVLSHSKLFFELYNLSLTGFFMPDLRMLLERSDKKPDLEPPLAKNSDLDPPPAKMPKMCAQKEYGHGCIYVPMPLSGSIFVFKSISKVDKKTEQILVESLKDQLEFIDKQLESSLPVQLMLTCSTQVFNSIKVKVEHKFRNVSLTFKNFHPKNKKTISDFNLEQKPVDGLKRLMEKIFENDRLVQKYELSEERFKHFGGETFSLSDHEKVLSLFKTYFPNFDTKLQMIPDINRIQDCLLYSTNEEAMFFNESKYLGEVKWFLDKLFPSLKSQGGLMIKNWDKEQLNEMLSPKTQFKSDFEYDYLMCCKKNLIVFEVGATQNSESPETTVKNKIEQSIAKIQPTLKVVANILLQQLPDNWFDSPTDKQSRIQDFINCNLKVVVYLPNVLIDGFKTVIGKDSVKDFIETIRPSVEQTASLEQIFFVMHKHHIRSKSEQLVTFKLNSNLEIEEIGNPRLVLDSGLETCEKLKRYVFALITFSALKYNREKEIKKPDTSPLDVDERYRENRNSLRSKTDSGSEPNFLDIILSPQQQSILDSNEARAWIRGEPGSGKTALLLAKAIREAKKEDKLVLYCIPRSAILLEQFIEKELERYTGTWKKHLWVFALWDDDNDDACYNSLEFQASDGNDAPRALFIDEIYLCGGTYGSFFEENKFQSEEVVWIAETVVEEEKKTLAVREGFKQFYLTVLYRNSHHISETATALVNEQKGVSASTAVIHGCYTSSQKDIDVEDYSTAGQLTKKLDDMLKPKFKNDEILFVCFTTRNYFYNSDPKLSPAEEALKRYSNDCYYPQKPYYYPGCSMEYAGCESKCVAIVIDERCNTEILIGILIITITRAQYEVLILVHESYKHKNILLHQIRRRAISSQIYANVKSGSKFTWPEQLTTANIKNVVEELIYKEESGGGLNEKDWLLLVQTMPTERRENGDITFADREDLIVEIIKSSLPKKLVVETLSEFSSEKIVGSSNSELLKDICQSVSIFTTKPELSVQQEKAGNRYSLQTLLRVIWEENRFGANPEEFNHIEEAITVMERNGLLKRHLERNDHLLSQMFWYTSTDKLESVLTTWERYNLLEMHLERNDNLITGIFENKATDKFELALTTLERYNLLERHLERNESLLTVIIENKATDKLELVLSTLERYNLLEKHLERNGSLLTAIIENKAPDKFELALTTLERYNLLERHLERNESLLTAIIENKANDKLELVLSTLEQYNLLERHLERNDSLLTAIIENKANDKLELVLSTLAQYNLLERHLERIDSLLTVIIENKATDKLELVLSTLERYNLLKLHLERNDSLLYQILWLIPTDKLEFVLATLKRYNLLEIHLERNECLLSDVVKNSATDKLDLVLATLKRYNLLEIHLERNESLLSDVVKNNAPDKFDLVLANLERCNLLERFFERNDSLLTLIIENKATDKLELVLSSLERYNLLERHLESNDILLTVIIENKASDKLELVLSTLERYNLLERHLERNGNLVTAIFENQATDKLELMLTTLERYNLLERHLESNGNLLTAITENKATDKLELMLTTLERYNLLERHLKGNDSLLTHIFCLNATDKLELVLTNLERYNLLEINIERNDPFLYRIVSHNATDKLELVLTTLERNCLLEKLLERNDHLLSFVIQNKTTDELELVLTALERYNLLEKYLKNDDKILPLAMFKMFDEYEYTVAKGKIEILLAPLKRYNLMQKFLESTSYVSQQTILQYLVGYENIKLNAFRIVFELGFPNRLLLHKNSDGEHVLHVAIHFSKSDFVKYLLDDDERRSIFISNEEDALYYDKNQSKNLNALQYAEHEYRDQSHSQCADHRRRILRYLKMLFSNYMNLNQ